MLLSQKIANSHVRAVFKNFSSFCSKVYHSFTFIISLHKIHLVFSNVRHDFYLLAIVLS